MEGKEEESGWVGESSGEGQPLRRDRGALYKVEGGL